MMEIKKLIGKSKWVCGNPFCLLFLKIREREHLFWKASIPNSVLKSFHPIEPRECVSGRILCPALLASLPPWFCSKEGNPDFVIPLIQWRIKDNPPYPHKVSQDAEWIKSWRNCCKHFHVHRPLVFMLISHDMSDLPPCDFDKTGHLHVPD